MAAESPTIRAQLTASGARAVPGAANHIVSNSPGMQHVLQQIAQVAPTPATVLLLGETGVGKEVLARAIHEASPRRSRPMISVSCGAIPTSLIESELFGRERGAFTDAVARQIGRFERADRSTLFLDEIGELPPDTQVKLLRTLEARTIERLGSVDPIRVDIRVIAATNRDLDDAVRSGRFRADLLYRLNVFPIRVPPLRERLDDLPLLVQTFIDEFARAYHRRATSIAPESLRRLQGHSWPGNVRELRNVIERSVIVSSTEELVVSIDGPKVPPRAQTLAGFETEQIAKVLRATNWRVRGPGGAAERLGLRPTTLESRMARLGIVRERSA